MLPRPRRALSEHRSLCCLSLGQGCGGPGTDSRAYEDGPTWLPTPSRGYSATSCSSCHPQGIMRYQLHQEIFAQGLVGGQGAVKIKKQNRSVTSLNVCLPASPRASPVPALGRAPIINHHPWRGNVRLIPGTYCGGRACLI